MEQMAKTTAAAVVGPAGEGALPVVLHLHRHRLVSPPLLLERQPGRAVRLHRHAHRGHRARQGGGADPTERLIEDRPPLWWRSTAPSSPTRSTASPSTNTRHLQTGIPLPRRDHLVLQHRALVHSVSATRSASRRHPLPTPGLRRPPRTSGAERASPPDALWDHATSGHRPRATGAVLLEAADRVAKGVTAKFQAWKPATAPVRCPRWYRPFTIVRGGSPHGAEDGSRAWSRATGARRTSCRVRRGRLAGAGPGR